MTENLTENLTENSTDTRTGSMTDHPETLTLESLLRSATDLLRAADVDSPRADAETLAAHVLGASRGQVAAWAVAGRRIDPVQSVDLRRLAISRSTRTPLQYLTGTTTFRTVDLAVGHGVFLPRPETELVAGAAIEAARAVDRSAGGPVGRPLVVDLCTGSGAIAASVAREVPGATVHAVEADPEAAWWAAANLDPLGVALHVADAAAALPQLDGSADVVVSNPPYVPAQAIPRDPEVRLFDPALALYGGEDGLDVVRVLSTRALRLLRSGGTLVIEHGELQGAPIRELLAADGWRAAATHRDLTLRDRATTAVRP